jgi:hypothetical protein
MVKGINIIHIKKRKGLNMKNLLLTLLLLGCNHLSTVNPPETFVDGLGDIATGIVEVGTLGLANPRECHHHKSGESCTKNCDEKCHRHHHHHHCRHHHGDEACSTRKCNEAKCHEAGKGKGKASTKSDKKETSKKRKARKSDDDDDDRD